MKVLIDDFRVILPRGEHPDILARNYRAGRWLLEGLGDSKYLPAIDLFIDHDLGSSHEHETGYDLICLLEEQVLGEDKMGFLPKSITCVSDNGAGRTRISLAIVKIYTEVNRL